MYESMSPSLRSPSVGLSDPELRDYLARYLRRRLPPADADDVLQAVYCAALEARTLPDDAVQLRRWMTVVARRKVAAYYERASAEQLGDPPEQVAPAAPIEAMSLLRWAERQAEESEMQNVDETLDWMARESEGEKLEAIAAEAALPATRVRQRVVRLRRFMRARFALELSAALLAAIVVWWLWSRKTEPIATPAPSPAPSVSVVPREPIDDRGERAAELRREALRDCALGRYAQCLRTLDDAAALDPAGDVEQTIVEARKHALESLRAEQPLEKLAPPAPAPQPTIHKPSKAKSSGTPSTGTNF